MVIYRGQIWWADLGSPIGSEPGYRRPLLVVQADTFNRSVIRTIVTVVLSSNLKLAAVRGNVRIPAKASGLPKDSVANVSQLLTVNRHDLGDFVGELDGRYLVAVENGLRLVLGL